MGQSGRERQAVTEEDLAKGLSPMRQAAVRMDAATRRKLAELSGTIGLLAEIGVALREADRGDTVTGLLTYLPAIEANLAATIPLRTTLLVMSEETGAGGDELESE